MIVEATDSADRISSCVLGLPSCSDENACPLHETWKELRSNMSAMLHQNTLADLAKVAQQRSKV